MLKVKIYKKGVLVEEKELPVEVEVQDASKDEPKRKPRKTPKQTDETEQPEG